MPLPLPATRKQLLEQLHPADDGHVRAGLTGMLEETFETVCRLRDEGGRSTWVHVAIEPGEGLELPVTVRALEAEGPMLSLLADRNDRLETMLATVPECFKIVDAEHRLIDMNPTGLGMIGAPSMPCVAGANVLDLVLQEHHELFREGVRKALEGNRVVQRFEIEGLQGTRRWMEQVAVALPPRAGKDRPDQVAAFTREITEDLERMRELSEARERADAANVAKSEFLANVSHEIRTPLTAILGFADLLQEGSLDADASADAISTIRRNGAHLLAVINDVLDLSKIEAKQMTLETLAVDPHALLDDVVSLQRPGAEEKGIALEVEWSSAPPARISTDPVRLRQILLNLTGNAIKFTAAGSVRVVAEHRKGIAGDELVMRVIDTGIGIPESAREAIFESFAQADGSTTRRFGGTGLGLAISRQLAEMLGGDLSVRSQVGVGSEFELRVAAPVAEAPSSPRRPALVRGPRTDLHGRRVLLAEDGRDNQRLIRLHLERAGASVDIVEDGAAALEALSGDGHTRFDLVLMDLQMPRMCGLEATRRIRESGLSIQVIALTANALTEDRDRALAAGCDAFLTKPLDVGLLLSAVAA